MRHKNKKSNSEMSWASKIDVWIKSKWGSISKWIASKSPEMKQVKNWIIKGKDWIMKAVKCPDCRLGGVLILFGALVATKMIDPWMSVAMLAWLKAASLMIKPHR
jgi:hypothetical protein|tara:strand:- start:165 stop:479 length:315 start_codon:yes stop_codon:yes gene_type:complete